MADQPSFADVKLRLAALEKEALLVLPTPVPSDAKPYFIHVQETFPYWLNRGDAFGVDSASEDFDAYTVPFVSRLVLGHLTSEYKGVNDGKLDEWIPHFIAYMNEHELLQSAAYPAAPDYLEEARVTNCAYYRQFQHSGIGGFQVGTEFTIACKFLDDIFQAYE
jgi:hypothetical protein